VEVALQQLINEEMSYFDPVRMLSFSLADVIGNFLSIEAERKTDGSDQSRKIKNSAISSQQMMDFFGLRGNLSILEGPVGRFVTTICYRGGLGTIRRAAFV
jgi:hypothetical protein